MLAPVSGDGVLSMAMSPRDASLVAVGFRSGLLCLIDALQEVLLHRVDAHDQELQGLAWTLTIDDSLYLATSSRDKTIKVWCATGNNADEIRRGNESEDGRLSASNAMLTIEHVLKLPTGKQGQAYNPSKHLWLPIAWTTTESESSSTMRLWSGSFDGNLLRWDIPLSDKSQVLKQVKPTAVKNGHNRILFNIIALPRNIAQQFDAEASAPSLMTVSLDRELRIWADATREPNLSPTSGNVHTIAKLLGLGGHVYSVSYSKQASTIALACGDQTIRLWKLDPKSGNTYDTELLWKGLKSKITSIAWHPTTPDLLAFGTEVGTLGVYDTQSKKLARFRSSHTGEVQQIAWRIVYGPSKQGGDATANGAEPDSFVEAMHKLEKAQEEGASLDDALVSLNLQSQQQSSAKGGATRMVFWSRDSSGQLFESDPEHPDTASHVLKNIRACHSFSWSEDDSAVAIAKPNGVVEFVDHVTVNETGAWNGGVVQDHEDRVCCISWTKNANTRLIATGGGSGQIIVYRIHGDDVNSPILVATFRGHSGKVNELKWQPVKSTSDNGAENGSDPLLGSCGADGCAFVWDVVNSDQLVVASFKHHVGRVLTLDWVSSTVIVTGGEDQSARIWDIHDYPRTSSADASGTSPQIMNSGTQQPATTSTVVATPVIKSTGLNSPASLSIEKASIPSVSKKSKKKKAPTNLALFHSASCLTPLADVATVFANQSAKSGRDDDYSDVSAAEITFAHGILAPPTENVKKSHDAVAQFLFTEQSRFASEENWEAQARILLLQGKLADALHVVAKEGKLDAMWVALAPMAGLDIWHEVTNLYAQQLVAKGDYAVAAFHFLGISKVRSAVQSLVEGAAFPEALALAKQRLGPSDPIVSEVALKYAVWLEDRGQFGDAALVYSSLQKAPLSDRAVRELNASTGDNFSWRSGAVRALVKTKNVACIAQAVDLLHELAQSSKNDHPGESPISLPAKFVTIDILAPLVREKQYVVAARAADLFVTISPWIRIHSSRPMAAMAFRLTRCLIAILEVFDKCASGDNAVIGESESPSELNVWQQRFPGSELLQLLEVLLGNHARNGGAYPSDLFSTGYSRLLTCGATNSWVHLATEIWSDVVGVFHCNGVWAHGEELETGEDVLPEAQDLLMDDENSWLLIEWRQHVLAGAAPSTRQLVDAGIEILRFIVDAMVGCLISSMEHLVRLLSDVVDTIAFEDGQIGDEKIDNEQLSLAVTLIMLLFPGGVSSSISPLLGIGELMDEPADARNLWQALQLLQCRVVVSIASRNPHIDYKWVESTTQRILEVTGLSNESEAAGDVALHSERLAVDLAVLQQRIRQSSDSEDAH